MINSIKQERVLDLILQRHFRSLSIKEENLLYGLIEKEVVNRKKYTQLLADSNKLIDYIIRQSEEFYGPVDINIQNAFKKFHKKIKSIKSGN